MSSRVVLRPSPLVGLTPRSFGICQTALTGVIVDADETYAAFMKRNVSELRGRHYLELTAKASRQISEEYFENFLATGQPYVLRKDYVDPIGNTMSSLISVCPLRDLGGELQGLLVICQPAAPRRVAPVAIESNASISPAPISGGQVRAARGWLGWSVRDLSEASGVSSATINRFESGNDNYGIRSRTLTALQEIFAERNISFQTDAAGKRIVSYRQDSIDVSD